MEEQVPQTKPPINRSKTPKREKSAPGSLDRRRHHVNRQERDQKSRSIHVPKSPPRLDDYIPQMCQNWCCSPHAEPGCFENFHRRHERLDPQRYGSNPTLIEQRYFAERGSHPDLYGDGGRFRHEASPVGCCSYHMPPPCCFFNDRSYHWPPTYSPKVLCRCVSVITICRRLIMLIKGEHVFIELPI